MFEYLTVESRAWMAAHPSVYPPHLARLIPTQEMLDAAEPPKAL